MRQTNKQSRIIVTGGSGLLGKEIQKLLTMADYPSSAVFDVKNYPQMEKYIEAHECDTILHAAAFTSPPSVDANPIEAIKVNVIGTGNVVNLCINRKIKLIYISTDYVFRGDKGDYNEEDAMYPVNKYAWSKLGGECAVIMYDNSLIIRTSFTPNEFPYEKAFIDQWTSRESVGDTAKKIVTVLDKDITGVIHIGVRRKTVFEHAKSLDEKKDIKPMSIDDVSFKVPRDTSLNISKYQLLLGQTVNEERNIE